MKKVPVRPLTLTAEVEAMILAHLPLAYKLSSGYHFVDREEPRAVAVEALVKAAAYYDPDKGFGFGVFAQRAILNSLKQQLDNNFENDHAIPFSQLVYSEGNTEHPEFDFAASAIAYENGTLPSSHWMEMLEDDLDARSSFEDWLGSLDERERCVIEYKLQGLTTPEIIVRMRDDGYKCSQPTFSRILTAARVKFEAAFHTEAMF